MMVRNRAENAYRLAGCALGAVQIVGPDQRGGHFAQGSADLRMIRTFEPAHQVQRLGDILESLLNMAAQFLEPAEIDEQLRVSFGSSSFRRDDISCASVKYPSDSSIRPSSRRALASSATMARRHRHMRAPVA